VSAPLHLHLELDLRQQPMVGRLWRDGDPAIPFTGWLGLVASLEGVTAAARTASTSPSEEDPHAVP
jgi:hypothetical protein